jgi:uracil-DNA glycosylase family 4
VVSPVPAPDRVTAPSDAPPDTAPGRASQARSIAELDALVSGCRACPRLVAWREDVAANPRASFAGQNYWGRAVPGFGPADARILVVGLAPAAHGANRTGRMFTGDRSGDFLFAALHRAGMASSPHTVSADDGLTLTGVRITSPVHCAPPANKPTTSERDTCAPFLQRELELMAPTLRVAVVLGGFGWQALLASLERCGWTVGRPRPKFSHGALATVSRGTQQLSLLGCFHVSQQNTFTGRLTPPMLDDILVRAKNLAGIAAQ